MNYEDCSSAEKTNYINFKWLTYDVLKYYIKYVLNMYVFYFNTIFFLREYAV